MIIDPSKVLKLITTVIVKEGGDVVSTTDYFNNVLSRLQTFIEEGLADPDETPLQFDKKNYELRFPEAKVSNSIVEGVPEEIEINTSYNPWGMNTLKVKINGFWYELQV